MADLWHKALWLALLFIVALAGGILGAGLNPAHQGARGLPGTPGAVGAPGRPGSDAQVGKVGLCIDYGNDGVGYVASANTPTVDDGTVSCDTGSFTSVKPAAVKGN